LKLHRVYRHRQSTRSRRNALDAGQVGCRDP
jgi:hypothetical protein